jgi:hypothetical protein
MQYGLDPNPDSKIMTLDGRTTIFFCRVVGTYGEILRYVGHRKKLPYVLNYETKNNTKPYREHMLFDKPSIKGETHILSRASDISSHSRSVKNCFMFNTGEIQSQPVLASAPYNRH